MGMHAQITDRGRRTRRQAARWPLAVLLMAVLGLVGVPTATATGGRTVTVQAPATVVAGVPFSVTVTVTNAAGKRAVGYHGTVRFSTDDPLVRSLPTAYTFTRTDRGVHTFTGVTLVGTGARAVVVSDDRRRLRDAAPVVVRDAQAAVEGQVLSGFDPVAGGEVTVYDAVTGHVVGWGRADIGGNGYRITGLPAGAVKLGAVVPGPYLPDFANDRDTLADADVFTLRPGRTLVQGWDAADWGPYLDVRHVQG